MTKADSKKFAVVIPAYNEGRTITDLARRALAYTDLVICIDDGSSDDTGSQLAALPVTLIRNETNEGKAASLWAGAKVALSHGVDIIITLDGDGQHSPDDIPLFLSCAEANPGQIIIGSRLADREAIPPKRYWANRIANFWISWAAGFPFKDSQSGFRLYPASLFKDIKISINRKKSFVFESEILIKAAHRGVFAKTVPIPAIYAKDARPSHFHGTRDITYITIMVAGQLFKRGGHPMGLYRSVIKPKLLTSPDDKTDSDGLLTFFLSSLVMLLTGGVFLLLFLIPVSYRAISTGTTARDRSVLLVFGKQLLNNKIDADYTARLDRAENLVTSVDIEKILVLGGKTGKASITEAVAGKEYLVSHGVTESLIHLEQSSRHTLENLKNVLDVIRASGQPNVTLISNRYHLARCAVMAKGFGLTPVLCAAEEHFEFSLRNLANIVTEAFFLHWYYTGKGWAFITRNKRMLDRIS